VLAVCGVVPDGPAGFRRAVRHRRQTGASDVPEDLADVVAGGEQPPFAAAVTGSPASRVLI